MDNNERGKALEDQHREMMEGDFNPGYTPEHMPEPEYRLANAAEYSAYQLGKLNRNLERLIGAVERLARSLTPGG